MATITPQMVKDLRERTGAGMAECKKALEHSEGSMEGAIEFLRKRGAASAEKRADRNANEGMVVALSSSDLKEAAIVEVNCETDFVARNEEFVQFVDSIASTVLSSKAADENQVWNSSVGEKTLGNLRDEILAKFSEKIELRRFSVVSQPSGYVASYIHPGNKLAVLVEFNQPLSDAGKVLARDIAMQIAAMRPIAVSREGVDTAVLEKEIEIYKDKALAEGKKPEIAEKIAQGQLNKFYQENCLLEQAFVKDSKMTVNDVVAQIGKESGNDVTITAFKRFALGESLS
ncbi:MAG: elongation factor Ts [Candidatus Kapabacteria bacterium]|nr:elongation factor Ts [Candidatus Kapabacteria bacterium]